VPKIFQAAEIESFLEADDETELILPQSLTPDEVDVIKEISLQSGLKVVSVEKPKRQIKVVKNV